MRQSYYGAGTDVGKIRSHNEDCFRSEPELGLWIVADGMGGHQGGEIASALAADLIVEKVRDDESLTKPVAEAHHAILKASQEGRGPVGMGTTVVALKKNGNQYEVAWVGDCRAYLWDGGGLHQLTKDHSYVQYLVDEGIISPEEAPNHAHQNFIMQALGATELNEVSVDRIQNILYRGEQILLCSDGLIKELTNKDIEDILSMEITEQEKVDRLIQAAVRNGGSDNITVVIVSANDDAPVRTSQESKSNILLAKIVSYLKQFFRYFE